MKTYSFVLGTDGFNGSGPVIGSGNGQVTLTGIDVPSQLTLNPDGTITINPGTPAGIYP